MHRTEFISLYNSLQEQSRGEIIPLYQIDTRFILFVCLLLSGRTPVYTHPILSQWWQVVHLTEVRLSLLYCLHAAVYGAHKRLLRQALMTQNKVQETGLHTRPAFDSQIKRVCVEREHLTSGGMCPLCICPIVICCWGAGMVPMLIASGPPTEPERMMPGSATDPCSTLPTRLNCCCKIVDLHTCEHASYSQM